MCDYLVTGCSSGSSGGSNVNMPPYKDPQGEYWELSNIVDNIPTEVGYEAFDLYEGTRGNPLRHFFRTIKAGTGITLEYDNSTGTTNNSIVINADIPDIVEAIFGPGSGTPTTYFHQLTDTFRSGITPPFEEGALLFYKLDGGDPNFNESWEATNGPSNNHIPQYNSYTKSWGFVLPTIGILQDVDTQGLADQTVLVWNETQQFYEHLPYGGGTSLPDGSALNPHIYWNTGTSEWEPTRISIFNLADINNSAIADDYILVYKLATNELVYEPKPTGGGGDYTGGQGINISGSNEISFVGGSLPLGTTEFYPNALGVSVRVQNNDSSASSTAYFEVVEGADRVRIKTGDLTGGSDEVLTADGSGGAYWKKVGQVATEDLPQLPSGGGTGKVLVEDTGGGLGLIDVGDNTKDGLEKLYDDLGPFGPGDMMIPSIDDTGFNLVNLDDEIANNTVVAANTAASHDALTLGGTAGDTTDDTLDLTGQVLTVNLATPTTDGAMSSTDKGKLDGIDSGANNYVHPNHTGDVTSTGDGVTVISDNAVSNTKLSDMPAFTLKGNDTGSSDNPKDLTVTEVLTLLDITTEFSYYFPQGATAIEDLVASDIQLQSVTKTAGINTVEISVNGGVFFDILTGLPYTFNSGDYFTVQITYNPLFNSGVVNFKGAKI